METFARGPRRLLDIALTLAVALAVFGFSRTAHAAQVVHTSPLPYSNFYGDGGCWSYEPDLECGRSWDTEFAAELPKFDHALGQLESVALDVVFLFSVVGNYDIIASTTESAPSINVLDLGPHEPREATSCVGLSAGATCTFDYGEIDQRFRYDFLDENEFQESGSLWWYADSRGGLNHLYGYQAIGELDLTFLNGTEFTVTYDYTPVPEPSTALLLSAGLLMLSHANARERGA